MIAEVDPDSQAEWVIIGPTKPAPDRQAVLDSVGSRGEDEYRKRLLKAIEQKVAGQEIQRLEIAERPPTTDLVATLKASLGRKPLAKAPPSSDGPNTEAPEDLMTGCRWGRDPGQRIRFRLWPARKARFTMAHTRRSP